MEASSSRRLGFPRPSSVEVLVVMVAAALVAACVALVVAQEPARASFPGQNGNIAFVRGNQIYTVSPAGGDPTQLTFDNTSKESLAWSPDGRKIAFVRGGPGNQDIYTMNADGSGQVAVTSSKRDDYDPAWSPDGRKLVFSRNVGKQPYPPDRDLFKVRSNGSSVVRLTRTDQSEDGPAWSPDGTTIAFSTYTPDDYGGYGRIHVMKADGSGPPAVLPHYYFGTVEGLGWSPDGQWFAFAAVHPRGSSITKVRADGSEEPIGLIGGSSYSCLDTPAYNPSSPDWSPDGTKMVFADACNGLVTMDADGANVGSIYGVSVGWPSWQPVVR